jgi:integrase
MRLPNGYGSVYKLSGKRRKPWCARKTVGWSFDEIKMKSYPIYEFIGYYPTRKEAMLALSDYNKDPYDLNANKITFAEVYEKWSDEKYETVSKSNITGYKGAYKICEPLYNMKMVDIKLNHLQTVIDQSDKNAPMLHKVKILYSQLFEYCVKHEILTPDKRQLVRYVDLSRTKNPNTIERIPFTKEEIAKLWSVEESNDYYKTILMLIYSGVRIAEFLDLKKEDVDLEAHCFKVTKSKTSSGVRTVPIADKVFPFFERWMQKSECDYLICNGKGTHFTYKVYYDYYWKPLLEDLGMEHRPHDTRHTCVSLLVAAGVDERFIKRIVGHKGQGVTDTIYTHVELKELLESINKI